HVAHNAIPPQVANISYSAALRISIRLRLTSVGMATVCIVPSLSSMCMSIMLSSIVFLIDVLSFAEPLRKSFVRNTKYRTYLHTHHLYHFILNSLKGMYTVYGCVFKTQFLFRVHISECALYHQCSFMVSAKDQFQFAGIGIDVTYSINPFYICRIIECVDFDRVFIDIQSPLGDRT